MERILEAWPLGTGDDNGELVAEERMRQWRSRGSGDLAGVETTLETKQLESGDLAAGGPLPSC